jgi:type II secretory pathway pseudopilin PulG
MLSRPRPFRGGFTLVEGAVVFAVLVVLSGIVLLRMSGSADPRNDSGAKAALAAFQDVQLDAYRKGDDPLDAAAASAAFSGSAVTFTGSVSAGVNEVGVAVVSSVVTGVARSGDDCWMLRLEFEPSPSSPPSWWFLLEGVETCEAGSFPVLSFPSDGSGRSPNRPTILG